MRRLLLIFILTLSFQTLTNANEVEEFKLEGMSVGDSLLKYYSKDKIKNNSDFLYKSKKFYTFATKIKSERYDTVQILLKNNDPKYLIYSISGKIFFDNKIDECVIKKDQIFDEILNFFSDKNYKTKSGKQKMKTDKSGKSFDIGSELYFTTGGKIKVYCSDWSVEMKYTDNLKVTLVGKELRDWFNSGGPYK